MLGGDKAFNDRLSWVLVLPLSALAWFAVYVAFLGLEVLAEGDQVGSARWWAGALLYCTATSAAVRFGAAVAPARKFRAALALTLVYGSLISILAYRAHGEPVRWRFICVALGWAGAAAAAYATRGLPDDDAEPAQAGAKPG